MVEQKGSSSNEKPLRGPVDFLVSQPKNDDAYNKQTPVYANFNEELMKMHQQRLDMAIIKSKIRPDHGQRPAPNPNQGSNNNVKRHHSLNLRSRQNKRNIVDARRRSLAENTSSRRYHHRRTREVILPRLSYRIVNSFHGDECFLTQKKPCILSNCIFADSFIYAGGKPCYISNIPLVTGAMLGYNSTIHQIEADFFHKEGFMKIEALTKMVKNSKGIVPSYVMQDKDVKMVKEDVSS